ncbi:MAG: macrolide transporter [Bdellovibrio sp.]|nr:MAG: macrolide transporter [Bdellovibrio sp.]
MKKIIWPWLVVGLIAGGAVALLSGRKSKPPEEFRQAKAVRGTLEISILSTGVVQPENRLEIKPPVQGRIERVLVKEGDEIHKGQTLAWMSSTERAALLDAARARGTEELEKWSDYYKATPIMAPIDGTLILRKVEPGQTFSSNDAVFVMSDRLTVKAQVDEKDIARIKLQQPAVVVLHAYPDHKIPAHVDQIGFDAKPVNNVTTYQVNVLPDRIPEFMRSGMTANVNFHLQSKINVILVASDALKQKNNRTYVLLMDPAGGSEPIEREVQTGGSDGPRTEIISGLQEDDVVLTTVSKRASSIPTGPFSPTPQRKPPVH